MSSLTAHLLEPGDHGQLRFHPGCPVCRRDRLSGTLSTEPVVSRRTQAVLAGVVIAFSAGTPGLGVAAVPDRQAEGVAAPEDPAGGELGDPEFDPGGETSLPFETAPAPSETAEEDEGAGVPIDAEPLDDPDGRLAPLVAEEGVQTEEGESTLTEGTAPSTGDVMSEGAEVPSPPVAELPPVGEVTEPESTAAPPETDRQGSVERSARDERLPDERRSARQNREGESLGPQTPVQQLAVDTNLTTPVAPPVPAAVTQPAADTAPTGAGRERGPSLRDARSYVVQPGDSLWSIAKRVLGVDASVARIAREVNRLWTLNEERIATGDPDLLMVGTKLKLR